MSVREREGERERTACKEEAWSDGNRGTVVVGGGALEGENLHGEELHCLYCSPSEVMYRM